MNSARLPIEFETIIHSSPYGGLTGLDFNGIKLFEEKDATNEPDYFIQLIVDIVNLLCLCVGFSIFTLIEIGYISMISLKNIYFRFTRRNARVECKADKF